MPETKTEYKALKGGEFLVKSSDPASIFIPENLDEEQKMIVQMADDFLDMHIWPKLPDIDKQEEGLMEDLLEKAGEQGLLGASLPEEYGGFGKDFITGTALGIAIGPSSSFGVCVAAHTGIGTLPILYFGTDDQKNKYLPGLANGKIKTAYCLTEPGSGSDALAAKSKAELSEDGSHYVLNGQKMWITNGGFADIFIVFAQVDGDKFTGFIVDANSEGITRGPEEHKMGIKGSSTCPIFFESVKVPVENLLGEVGKGHKIAFDVLNIGRFKLCAFTVGGCKRSVSISVAYANDRKQFQKFISSFGAIQYKLSEQVIRTFVAESATYRTATMIQKLIKELTEGGMKYEEALKTAAEEYAVECAILKVLGSEALDYVTDEMVQIHGGYGYSEEFPASRAYRDSRINRIFEGTNEINRLLTVDMLLKKALKGKIDLIGPATAIQKELMSVPDVGSGADGPFSKQLKAIENGKKAILMIAGAAVQKLMQKITDEQEIVMNIADMLIDIFAAEACLLRTIKLSDTLSEEALEPYKAITDTNLVDALDRVAIAGKHAIAGFADGDEKRMMLMGLKRFTKYDVINTIELRRLIAGLVIKENRYSF